MNFQDALAHLNNGRPIVLYNRKGGRLVLRSWQKALKKMGPDDYLSDDWELCPPKKKKARAGT